MTEGSNHIDVLLHGCRQNNRNSQRDLYYLLHGYAMKICIRYSGITEESEELVNESFVKLFKNIQQFDAQRSNDTEALLKGWFKRIIVNTCIDHFRRNHHAVAGHTLAADNENIPDNQESALDKISYDEIIQAIRLLSPVYRTVFNLFVLEGLSHDEIATQLGISVGASKSNLSKARNNLRKIITQQTHFKQYA